MTQHLLNEGRALLARIEKRQRDQEARRRNFVVVDVPVRTVDGVRSVASRSVPRTSIEKALRR